MPTVLDLLSAPQFADPRLTEVINIPPYETGRLAQLGLFEERPIATTYVKVAIRDGEVIIIPARERGGPSNKNMREDRRETIIPVPHFPLDDAITPSDLQNLTVYGSNYVMETLSNVYVDKLSTIRGKHDATHAHLDWGAVKGQIIDAEGKVLLNTFSHFGISQTTYDLILGTAGTNVAAKTRGLKSLMRTKLKGARSSGVHIFAGPEYFDAFVGHSSVQEAFKYFAAAPGQNPNRDDIADVFRFGSVSIERVEEEFDVRQLDNSFITQPAITSDEAIAIPLGTPYFKRYIAPPDTITDANSAPAPGSKVVVSTERLPHGKGQDIHTESNVLPVCLRPEVLIKLEL